MDKKVEGCSDHYLSMLKKNRHNSNLDADGNAKIDKENVRQYHLILGEYVISR